MDAELKGAILSSLSGIPSHHLIGEAVIILLKSKRRVTIGNILDVLVHKKYAAKGHAFDELRETIISLRRQFDNQ